MKKNVCKEKTAQDRVNEVASLKRKAKRDGGWGKHYSIKGITGNSVESALITMLSSQGSLEESTAAITQLYINMGLLPQWESTVETSSIKSASGNTNNHIYALHKNPSNKIRVQFHSSNNPINIYRVPSTTLDVRKTKINRYSPCLRGAHSLAGEKDAQINKCKIMQMVWIYLFKYDYSTGIIHFKHKQISIGSPTCSTWQTCYLS